MSEANGLAAKVVHRLLRTPGYEPLPIVGSTVAEVLHAQLGSEELIFVLSDGRRYRFWYEHDCCASAVISEIVGDLGDLLGVPLVYAEEAVHANDDPPDAPRMTHDESHTWTFYRFWTEKGLVVIRWLGSSNGYYSESVSHEFMKDGA